MGLGNFGWWEALSLKENEFFFFSIFYSIKLKYIVGPQENYPGPQLGFTHSILQMHVYNILSYSLNLILSSTYP